jgi:hypothetical protein
MEKTTDVSLVIPWIIERILQISEVDTSQLHLDSNIQWHKTVEIN